jgi:nicotinamide mononucleotide transporter
MMDIVLTKLQLTSPWELVVVVLALAYLLLAVKRSLWCWLFAFTSSAISVALMYEKRLYMQGLLSVFYVVMAIYGYFEWRSGRNREGEVQVRRWPLASHAVAIAGVVAISVLTGWQLAVNTDAASPYLDAFTTWGSVLTTWMVARRLMENWLYWIVVDGVTAFLYFQQDLNYLGLLFVAYIGIVIHGYRVWMRETRAVALPDAA